MSGDYEQAIKHADYAIKAFESDAATKKTEGAHDPEYVAGECNDFANRSKGFRTQLKRIKRSADSRLGRTNEKIERLGKRVYAAFEKVYRIE